MAERTYNVFALELRMFADVR